MLSPLESHATVTSSSGFTDLRDGSLTDFVPSYPTPDRLVRRPNLHVRLGGTAKSWGFSNCIDVKIDHLAGAWSGCTCGNQCQTQMPIHRGEYAAAQGHRIARQKLAAGLSGGYEGPDDVQPSVEVDFGD